MTYTQEGLKAAREMIADGWTPVQLPHDEWNTPMPGRLIFSNIHHDLVYVMWDGRKIDLNKLINDNYPNLPELGHKLVRRGTKVVCKTLEGHDVISNDFERINFNQMIEKKKENV